MINSNSRKSPIFIVGTPRSGTTLTSKILGRHTHIFMPGETHFFEDIYSRKTTDGTNFNKEDRNNIIERLLTLYSRFNEPGDQKRVDFLCEQRNFKQELFDRLTEMGLGKIIIEEEEIKLYPLVRKRLEKEGILHYFELR